MRGGAAPFCCSRVRSSQPARHATTAVAAVNSHCHEGGRNTSTRTKGIRTTAVSTRFIGGLRIHAHPAAVLIPALAEMAPDAVRALTFVARSETSYCGVCFAAEP